MQDNEAIVEYVDSRIRCNWIKWREDTGELWRKTVPLKVAEKLYRTVVKLVLMYRSECWEIIKKEGNNNYSCWLRYIKLEIYILNES